MTGNCSPSEVIFKPRNRQANLNERRRLKMARSAHAYVRGSTVKFYEWLESSRGKRCPKGLRSGFVGIVTLETSAR